MAAAAPPRLQKMSGPGLNVRIRDWTTLIPDQVYTVYLPSARKDPRKSGWMVGVFKRLLPTGTAEFRGIDPPRDFMASGHFVIYEGQRTSGGARKTRKTRKHRRSSKRRAH